jgi:meiosis induction protein kinase IME2/SME1
MQLNAAAKPQWTGKRLVVVKRMKREFGGGWIQCKSIMELQVSFGHSSLTMH